MPGLATKPRRPPLACWRKSWIIALSRGRKPASVVSFNWQPTAPGGAATGPY